MRLGKWLVSLVVILQLGSDLYVQPGEVIAVKKAPTEATAIYLKGGAVVYSDWTVEKIFSGLLDTRVIENQINPFSFIFFEEDGNGLVEKIRKESPHTIFDYKPEEEEQEAE